MTKKNWVNISVGVFFLLMGILLIVAPTLGATIPEGIFALGIGAYFITGIKI